MKLSFSVFLSVIIAVIALIFAFQNIEVVNVSFFEWGFSAPVSLVIIASLLIGFVIGLIFFVPNSMASKWKIKLQKEAIEKLQKKLEEETIKYDSEGLGVEGETRGSL